MTNDHDFLRRIVDEGMRQPQAEIIIPPGTYYCEKPLHFNNVSRRTFKGVGVTIVMSDVRESVFVFNHCHHITLNGFIIDYQPLPFTQATVVSINEDATEFTFEIHGGYREFEVTGNYGFGFRAEAFYPNTLLGKINDLYPIEKKKLSPRHGYIKTATPTPSLALGDYLAFVNRENDFIASAIEFKHCATVRLEDLTILASPGMAVYCTDMNGENYFRYKVARGPRNKYAIDRLISTNADGLHYHGGRQGPIIEKCDFAFMSDDSVNINGPSFVVNKIKNSHELWIEAFEFNAIFFNRLKTGDLIRFMSPDNYEIVAEAQIKTIGDIKNLHEVTDDKLRKIMDAGYAGGLIKRGRMVLISCDRPLKLSGNEYCNVFNFNCRDFKISHSHFHDHRAVGLRIFGTDGVIKNNLIERTKFAAINIGPAYFGSHDGWGKNITIMNNKIRDCALFSGEFPGAISVSTAEISNRSDYKYPLGMNNIIIKKNTIKNCGSSGIFVNATDGVCIRNNNLDQTNQQNRPHCMNSVIQNTYAIDVKNSSHLDIAENTVKKTGMFCAGIQRLNA